MSVITKGRIFANGEQLTAEKLNALVDDASFNSSAAVDNSTTRVSAGGAITVKPQGVTSTELASSAVTTAKIADATGTSDGVTFAKMRRLENMKTIGNVSGSTAAPTQVDILDEDNMSSDSATSLATQQSIKAYVDNGGGHSPTSYSGGESVTLPNGLIIKMGSITCAEGAATTVTFSTAFPNGFVSASATIIEDTNNDRHPPKLANAGASSMQIRNTNGTDLSVYWVAYGH